MELPQVAIDNINEHVPDWVISERMPDFLQAALQPQYHFATAESDSLVGRSGIVDFFVFDTDLSNTKNEFVDTIVGFEAGVDVIVYSSWSEHSLLKMGQTNSDGDKLQDTLFGFQNTKSGLANRIVVEDVNLTRDFAPVILKGDFQGHAVHRADAESNKFVGTDGVLDYFVFDMSQLNTDRTPDYLSGFEVDVDKIVLTNFGEKDQRYQDQHGVYLYDAETGLKQFIDGVPFVKGRSATVIETSGDFLV